MEHNSTYAHTRHLQATPGVLNVRETELIGRLHELTQEKLKGLAAQRDQIETTLAQLHSCLHFMRESLRPGNELYKPLCTLTPSTHPGEAVLAISVASCLLLS